MLFSYVINLIITFRRMIRALYVLKALGNKIAIYQTLVFNDHHQLMIILWLSYDYHAKSIWTCGTIDATLVLVIGKLGQVRHELGNGTPV